jgi:GTPase
MALLPTVVLVGRPNVGKSTLFNRLTKSRNALVHDQPGLTRDRHYGRARAGEREYLVVDTGGFEPVATEGILFEMAKQAKAAIAEADVIIFIVDARSGLAPGDTTIADLLRRTGRPVLLAVNKAEGMQAERAANEFHELGLGQPLPISAAHGENVRDLVDLALERIPAPPADATDDEDGERRIKVAIVGRPNVGKSTLLNRLIGEERMLTGPEPGLTRDAVAVVLHDRDGPIELVDTAGMRRRGRIEAPLEKLSVGASIGALKLAEIVVLVVDATEGLHDQDLQIAQLIEREGRACVLAFNKWDAVADRSATRKLITERLEESLAQVKGIPVVTISALTGAGLDKLLPAVRRAHAVWNTRLPTASLNRWFEQALARHQPPLVSGRRLKLRYITQAKARPPTFIAFGTRAEMLPEDYQRYLVNSLRETFELPGTPIRLQLRGTKNPYADA